MVMTAFMTVIACAQAPYYYGTYNQPDSNTPPPNQQPAVIYQPVPAYRVIPAYQEPSWASPNAAALGPWKWNFDFGGGPTVVAGNNPLQGGANFEIGGGYNFTPRAGFVLEFMDNGLGVTDTSLQPSGSVNAHADVWGITLNPIWRFRIGGPVGGYLIGGGGYYQRDIWFDEPVSGTFPSGNPFQGYQRVYQDDDTGGVNAGLGLTCNLGWGIKLFVEARYHYIFTSGSATQIIPVTIGFRW
jgi:hypothetical protein